MNPNNVMGFNLYDNNFSRDASELSLENKRVVEGFYGYEARDGPEVAPLVFVTLQSNANLKVTWDMPNLTRWSSSPVNHYFIVLRELESSLKIYIGRTENASREFTVDLTAKYYLYDNRGNTNNPPTNNIKDNIVYDILIYAVDEIQSKKNAQLNNAN